MIEFQNRQVQIGEHDIIISRLKGSINGTTLLQFEKTIMGFLEQGYKHLILVFSEVEYINSTGMGVLIKLVDEFSGAGGEINLVQVPEKLIALFNMLGLLSLVKVSSSEEESMKALQTKLGGEIKKEVPQTSSAPEKKVEKKAPEQPAKKPKTASQAKPSPEKKKKKVYLIKCRNCGAKISLGTSLQPGGYRCPSCKVIFKVLSNGKIRFP